MPYPHVGPYDQDRLPAPKITLSSLPEAPQAQADRPKTNRTCEAVLVCGDKGGIGKDLIAQGVMISAMRRKIFGRLVEVEIAPRLARLYPEALHIPAATVSAVEIYRNPDVVLAPMDALAAACRDGSGIRVASLGANLTTAFQVWSQTNGQAAFGDGAALVFTVVLTMNRDALVSGLANLFELGRLYPAARRVAVQNCVHAEFLQGDRNLAARLAEAQGDGLPIETVTIQRMTAPAWGYMEAHGSLLDIANLSAADLVGLGLPHGPVVRSLALYERWLADDLVAPLAAVLPDATA
jgi:hypothetical protein